MNFTNDWRFYKNNRTAYNDPYTSPYGYDWTNYYANTYNPDDEYNYNQYYGDGYNEQTITDPYYSEGRNFKLALGGPFGSGVQTIERFWEKFSGKASRALDR